MIINKKLEDIISMDNDDLRELLLEENTNSQELKELIYRLISHSKQQERKLNNCYKEIDRLENNIENLKEEIIKKEIEENLKDFYPDIKPKKPYKF